MDERDRTRFCALCLSGEHEAGIHEAGSAMEPDTAVDGDGHRWYRLASGRYTMNADRCSASGGWPLDKVRRNYGIGYLAFPSDTEEEQ